MKYSITPEIHKEIQAVYQTMTGNGEARELANKFGIPRWKISRYALRQGWKTKCKKEPNWSEEELKILERNAHISPERIQIKLKRSGFKRSLIGIVLKRQRMRFLQNLNGMSANCLALCFGIDSHCVTRWIEQGLLKAKRRGTKRTEKQGGDMFYVKDQWIKQFIIENISIIDIRKIDKYWLVDILSLKPSEM